MLQGLQQQCHDWFLGKGNRNKLKCRRFSKYFSTGVGMHFLPSAQRVRGSPLKTHNSFWVLITFVFLFFFCFSPLKILIYSDLEIKHFILILKFHPLPLNVKIASDRFKYCVSTHDKLSSALHASVLCFSPAHAWLREGERPVRPLLCCLPIAQESSMLVGPTHKTSIMHCPTFQTHSGTLISVNSPNFLQGAKCNNVNHFCCWKKENISLSYMFTHLTFPNCHYRLLSDNYLKQLTKITHIRKYMKTLVNFWQGYSGTSSSSSM